VSTFISFFFKQPKKKTVVKVAPSKRKRTTSIPVVASVSTVPAQDDGTLIDEAFDGTLPTIQDDDDSWLADSDDDVSVPREVIADQGDDDGVRTQNVLNTYQ